MSVGGATAAGETSPGTMRETGVCGAAAGGDAAPVDSPTGGGEGGGAIGADPAFEPCSLNGISAAWFTSVGVGTGMGARYSAATVIGSTGSGSGVEVAAAALRLKEGASLRAMALPGPIFEPSRTIQPEAWACPVPDVPTSFPRPCRNAELR